MTKIKCSNCDAHVTLSKDEKQRLSSANKSKRKFIMLTCDSCGLSFSYNLIGEINMNDKFDLSKYSWRSPIGGSHGFVSYIEDTDGNFFGCGETGAIWKTKEAFYRDIERIINKYPHRRHFYKKVGADWLPNNNEPKNINQMIDMEETEDLVNFVRD